MIFLSNYQIFVAVFLRVRKNKGNTLSINMQQATFLSTLRFLTTFNCLYDGIFTSKEHGLSKLSQLKTCHFGFIIRHGGFISKR